MITLSVDQEYFDLSEKRLNLRFSNPVFDPEQIERAYTLPFSIPHTPQNLRLLAHGTRFDARERSHTPIKLYLHPRGHGFPGTLKLQKITPTKSEAVFQSTTLDVGEYLKNRRLRALLSTITLPDLGFAYQFLINWQPDPDTATYGLTINGFAYVVNGVPAVDVRDELIALINAEFPDLATIHPTDPDRFIISDTEFRDIQIDSFTVNLFYEYLNPIGDSIHTAFKMWFADKLDSPLDECAFPLVYHPRFYGENNPQFKKFINHFYRDGVTNNFYENEAVTVDSNVWFNACIPFVRAKYMLERIAQDAGLSGLSGAFTGEWEDLLIYNNVALDQVRTDLYESFDVTPVEKDKNIFVRSFDLAKHVPDITAFDFLNILSSLGFSFSIRLDRLHVTQHTSYTTGAARDLTADTNPLIDITLNDLTGLKIDYLKDTKETYTDPTQLTGYTYGDAKKQINLPWRTLFDANVLSPYINDTVRCCVTERPGSSPVFKTEDYPFMFFFDRGMQPALGGVKYYSTGVHGVYDANGFAIGTITLELDGADGIVNTFLFEFYKLQFGDTVTINSYLTAAQVTDIVQWQQNRVKIYHPNGTVFMLIKEIEVTPSEQYFNCRITGVKIKSIT